MLVNRPLIIAYDGKGVTHLLVDGKVYGNGIRCIYFKHKGAKYPKKTNISVEITADDVNIVGDESFEAIHGFRSVIDNIMKNAPCK